MNNTIILQKGFAILTENEYKKFSKGDTIWGVDADPEQLKRWNIKDEKEAKAELAKYRCSYTGGYNNHYIEEYALEYCECDEDGDFMQGSDFELAEEEN